MSESSIKFICLKPDVFISDLEQLYEITSVIAIGVSEDDIVIIGMLPSVAICVVYKYYPGDIIDWKKEDFVCNTEYNSFVINISIVNLIKALKPLKSKLKKQPKDIIVEINEHGGFSFIDIDKKNDKQNHVHGKTRVNNEIETLHGDEFNFYSQLEDILHLEYILNIPFNSDLIIDDIETASLYEDSILLGYNNKECSLTIETENYNGEHAASILLKDFGEISIDTDLDKPFIRKFSAKMLLLALKNGKKYNKMQLGAETPLIFSIVNDFNGLNITRGWLLISPVVDFDYTE